MRVTHLMQVQPYHPGTTGALARRGWRSVVIHLFRWQECFCRLQFFVRKNPARAGDGGYRFRGVLIEPVINTRECWRFAPGLSKSPRLARPPNWPR